ncbi:diguanylate cyclase [Alkalilimnicola ehrlichii MLHE-1]|uniref:diguanylate cyclase n=1 Tax=Alkalilimnicola ehrlichii (strain ATCC BAA-1101 / DSM 17681 / MLHE-1) TaxID=187272 RepID=Q0A6W8_ALKEH|nr:GGDEF domain-containing protein [Alkalilimnicola ehrlichii]ABI57419.1 diguanylate cyclase [Alkalilimnicola ehrlichii MLHE-1]
MTTPPAMQALHRWLERLSLPDLLDTRGHSQDFSGSRAGYINTRIRPLALVLALLIPAWIPVDYAFMPIGEFTLMALLRVACTAVLLGLFFWCGREQLTLPQARLRLGLLITIPLLLYGAARLLLNGDVAPGLILGYSFFPVLTVAMLTVFPLTLREALGYLLPVLLVYTLLEIAVGRTLDLQSLGGLWLLVLVALVAAWSVAGQLLMLLRLYRQATRDPLTGLFNRRALTEQIERERARFLRTGRPLTVLLFDLDRFKRINDHHGHLVGDRVLQVFANVVQQNLRTTDHFGRWGGEEFLAALPETTSEQARVVAERVRQACENERLTLAEGPSLGFTTSIGVATLHRDETLDSLFNRVDEALYNAKAYGRNRVVEAEVPASA